MFLSREATVDKAVGPHREGRRSVGRGWWCSPRRSYRRIPTGSGGPSRGTSTARRSTPGCSTRQWSCRRQPPRRSGRPRPGAGSGCRSASSELDRHSTTLYNSQLLFDADGRLVQCHRKLMPTGGERLVWGMGDGSTLGVVETPFGLVGTLACWENYMPLARAALYGAGRRHLPRSHVGQQRCLDRLDAPHRQRGTGLRGGGELLPPGQRRPGRRARAETSFTVATTTGCHGATR